MTNKLVKGNKKVGMKIFLLNIILIETVETQNQYEY